jgi:hypothetical protein
VHTCRSTASAGKAKLKRQAHGAEREREKRTRGAMARELVNRARETERERGSARAKETGADRLAPPGREREREGAREGKLLLTGGVRLLGGAGTRPGWA